MSSILLNALADLLVPLARFALRHSISFREVDLLLRQAFVKAAEEELRFADAKTTLSSISIRTGLTRREVKRIQEGQPKSIQARGLIPRVIGQWQADKRFSDSTGARELKFLDSSSEFYQLCAIVTKDVPAGTILSDMLRLNYVSTDGESLKLLVGAAETKNSLPEAISNLSAEFGNLIKVCEENTACFESEGQKHHHANTEYDRIRSDKIPEIKAWLYREGSRFHELIRAFLAPYDLDINPDPAFKDKVAKVSFSSSSYAEVES